MWDCYLDWVALSVSDALETDEEVVDLVVDA